MNLFIYSILLLLFILATQYILFLKLKQLIKMTAQETLEAFVTEMTTAKDAIIARIDEILLTGGDLTAQEVSDILTPLRDDLNAIGNPPPPTD